MEALLSTLEVLLVVKELAHDADAKADLQIHILLTSVGHIRLVVNAGISSCVRNTRTKLVLKAVELPGEVVRSWPIRQK